MIFFQSATVGFRQQVKHGQRKRTFLLYNFTFFTIINLSPSYVNLVLLSCLGDTSESRNEDFLHPLVKWSINLSTVMHRPNSVCSNCEEFYEWEYNVRSVDFLYKWFRFIHFAWLLQKLVFKLQSVYIYRSKYNWSWGRNNLNLYIHGIFTNKSNTVEMLLFVTIKFSGPFEISFVQGVLN